jgi:Flp pilus assembly protein TadB
MILRWWWQPKKELKRLQYLSGGYAPTQIQNTPLDDSLFFASEFLSLPVFNSFRRLFILSGVKPKAFKKGILQCTFFALLLSGIIFSKGTGSWKLSALLPLFIVPLWCYLFLHKKKILRVAEFQSDYSPFLLSLSSSVKAGLEPLAALIKMREILPESSPVYEELIFFSKRLESGCSEEEAILNFGNTIDYEDIKLFRTALLLARRQGGALSLCLTRLAKVTRTRSAFKRRVGIALAMQKSSSLGILLCAFGILIFQFITKPQSVLSALKLPMGQLAFGVGGCLMLVGVVAMYRLSSREV